MNIVSSYLDDAYGNNSSPVSCDVSFGKIYEASHFANDVLSDA